MPGTRPILDRWRRLRRDSPFFRYGGAVVTVWLALCIWILFPLLHSHPFEIFLAAAVFTARFFGLGPALVCSALSVICLDFVVLLPRFGFDASPTRELGRLVVFLCLSVLVGSLSRQRTKAELRAEEAMREMASIIECSDDAIFSTNQEGMITSWNRGAQRLYGYRPGEAIGKSIVMLVPPDRRTEAEHNRDELRQGRVVPPYQTERMRKNGTRVPILFTIAPLRNAKDEIVGSWATARDISAQRHSEEAVRRTEKLATAGRMAAAIAHEINNPLEAVLNLLYLARNDPRKAEHYLTIAEEEVRRVARLAQQTLGSVRDSSNLVGMDPAVIMDEILQLYSRKLEHKRVQVKRCYRGKFQISGYSGEVRQLLTNLIVNAADAMGEGGCLRVRVTRGRHWPDGTRGVRLTVADDGSGIPPENLQRLFEPFYTTKHDAGTGLGLWVSRGIVNKHGGAIRVRSRIDGPYRGTVFSVFFPAAEVVGQVA